MRIPAIPILVSFVLVNALHAQPAGYYSRGVKSYLVNYNAIKGDRFLAEFAAHRFALIDEAGGKDIQLIHAVNPDMPILRYKDIVALYPSMPEYPEVNRDEWAFIHSCEPAGTTIRVFGDTAYVDWIPDRRGGIAGYRLYWMLDSLAPPMPLNVSLFKDLFATIRLPKSAKFLMVCSETEGGEKLQFGLPVRIPAQDTAEAPLLIPEYLSDTRSTDTVRLMYVMREVGTIHPDTVYIIGDWDRNNQLHPTVERFPMTWAAGKWRFSRDVSIGSLRSNCGYEFKVEIHHNGTVTTLPETGKWHSNVNNRTKNDTYGFYVMNVGSSTWRKAFTGQVLEAFNAQGYSGLFEDDCWYRIENYGVDSYPPVPYNGRDWLDGLYQMLDSIRIGIAPRPAYFNGLYTETSDSLLLHTDGGMTEGFACTHWSGVVAGNTWRQQCNRGLSAQHRYKKTWMALGGAPWSLIDERMYVLGSYLLLADSLSMFANATDYQEFAHFPEFDIPLGKPLESAGTDIEDLHLDVSGERIYIREYENGTVVVNPAAVPVVYAGANNRKSIIPAGGLTVNGGRIDLENTVNLLHPVTARIYLNLVGNETLESPVIDAIVVNPSVIPADGSTMCTVSVLAHDSSAVKFRSDPSLPLYVVLDAGTVGGPKELVLAARSQGSPEKPVWFDGSFTLPVGAPPDSVQFPVTVYAATGLITVGRAEAVIANADSGNLLLNYSFEIDNNEDGAPDFWRPYGKAFDYDIGGAHAVTGSRSIHVINDSLTESRGVYVNIDLNQKVPEKLYLAGWAKAVDVSGARNNDFSIYADLRYTDGTSLYGQTAPFNTGTHDWEYSEKVITPVKPVKSVSLYAFLRNHSGEAWFDHITLRKFNSTAVPDIPAAETFHTEVYPNPVTTIVNVVVSGMQSTPVSISVCDVLGRTLSSYSRIHESGQKTAVQFQANEFAPGMYFIRVKLPSGIRVHPIAVTK